MGLSACRLLEVRLGREHGAAAAASVQHGDTVHVSLRLPLSLCGSLNRCITWSLCSELSARSVRAFVTRSLW